jgi:hypothetical protein
LWSSDCWLARRLPESLSRKTSTTLKATKATAGPTNPI